MTSRAFPSFRIKLVLTFGLVVLADLAFWAVSGGSVVGVGALAWVLAIMAANPAARRGGQARIAAAVAVLLGVSLIERPGAPAWILFWTALTICVLSPRAPRFDNAGRPAPFTEGAYADYKAAARDPAVIHAMCEDYRAGATYDVVADRADQEAGRKIVCPVQVLWGSKGAVGNWYDVMAVWRDWAHEVVGEAIDCGHFIPEEKPAECLAALRRFHI